MGRPSKEFQAFNRMVDRLLSVPRSVIEQGMREHRERAAQNPRKRGPKPKVKPPAATDPDVESGNG